MTQLNRPCECPCNCESRMRESGICGFCRKGLHWEPDSPLDTVWVTLDSRSGHEKGSATLRIMGTGRGPKARS